MANTTLKASSGRQSPLFAEVAIALANIADSAVAVDAIHLPVGAQVVGGALIVDEAFNFGTTSTAGIGDSSSATRYGSAVDLKTPGRTALTLTGYVSDGSPIRITPAHAGTAATTGKARLQVMYVIGGRATEVQPA